MGGLLVVLAAFAVGTENQRSTMVMGHIEGCGPSISASWLVSGTPDRTLNPGSAATPDERRTAAACSPVIRESRALLVATMGLGGLLALVGWTAMRERPEAKPRQVAPAQA